MSERKRKANAGDPHKAKTAKIAAKSKIGAIVSNISEDSTSSLEMWQNLKDTPTLVMNEITRTPVYSSYVRPKVDDVAKVTKKLQKLCRNKPNIFAQYIETTESDGIIERDNECRVCHKFFNNKNFCDAHTLLHFTTNPPKCRYCDEIFPLRYDLYAHESKHLRDIGYECNICLLKFLDVAELRTHMRYHTESERNLECDICGSVFTNLRTLQIHKKLHYLPHHRDFYKCAQCPLMFYNIGEMRVHCRTHYFYKPYECEICRLTFNNAFSFYCHSTNHILADTQYSCTKCGYLLKKDGMKFNDHKCNIKA